MAHFAELDEKNVVVAVYVVGNEILQDEDGVEQESLGAVFLKELYGQDKTFIQTSYSKSFRGYYAAAGYTYDYAYDVFIPPQPFDSWAFNYSLCKWQAPTPMPEDGVSYMWDEATLSWVRALPPLEE